MNPVFMFILFIVSGLLLTLYRQVVTGKIKMSSSNLARFRKLPWDLILVVLILSFLYSGSWLLLRYGFNDARADWPFEESPVFILGAQYEFQGKTSVFCEDSAGDWVGNVGIEQTVMKYNNFEIDLNYTHHSCAFEEDDKNDFNAAGFSFRYKFW